METHTFWMPDYYPEFSCKMGACRNACCTGWPVSFSLTDYFKLISEDCGPAMREKLDRGIKVCLHPTPDRYAEILPRFDGNCPMRLEDGRCALHVELGEQSLSDVCRLYPRGIREEESGLEISCANSCEAVLELLLRRRGPLSFTEKELSIALPPLQKRTFFFNTQGKDREIRLSLIRTMQNRSLSLPERLQALEDRLITAEEAMRTGSEGALADWLGAENKKTYTLPSVSPEHLTQGLETAEQLIRLIDERSVSIRAYGEEALARFGHDEGSFERYSRAKQHFSAVFPDWEIFFENMLVNHMFFTCFPFEDRPEDLRTEYMALCAVYTLLRFLSLGCSENRNRPEDFIELFASAFRLIDHTAFDIYVSHLLDDIGWTSDKELLEWIIL